MKRSYFWMSVFVVLGLIVPCLPAAAAEDLESLFAPEQLMTMVPKDAKIIGQEVRKLDPADDTSGIGVCHGCVCVVCRQIGNGEVLCIEYELCN